MNCGDKSIACKGRLRAALHKGRHHYIYLFLGDRDSVVHCATVRHLCGRAYACHINLAHCNINNKGARLHGSDKRKGSNCVSRFTILNIFLLNFRQPFSTSVARAAVTLTMAAAMQTVNCPNPACRRPLTVPISISNVTWCVYALCTIHRHPLFIRYFSSGIA